MDESPIFIVLSIFDECPINIAKTLAHLFETVVVTAISRKIDFVRRAFEEEWCPKRVARMKETSWEMLGGKAVELNLVVEKDRFVPIQFRDGVWRISPSLEVFSYTKGTHHASDTLAKTFDGAIV